METINIYDENFITYDVSSTFGKSPKSFKYVVGHNIFDGITIYTDRCFNKVHTTNSTYNIAWQVESPVHSDKQFYPMLKYADKFDMIITYDESLITSNPDKYKRGNFGGTTVSDPQLFKKTKNACIVHSGKKDTPNHTLRAKIIQDYSDTLDIYGKVTGMPFGNIQDVYKNYRFAVVIENLNHSNYFSEKLTDAFACGTIPIYCGSIDGVSRYFNKDGVIPFTTFEEIADILNNATDFTTAPYDNYRTAMIDNYNTVINDFYTNEDWLYNNYLKQLLKN